jgi:hypothetical protein
LESNLSRRLGNGQAHLAEEMTPTGLGGFGFWCNTRPEILPKRATFSELSLMSDYPGASWFERYRSRVNADPEMNVIGDWFSTSFTLAFGENRHALKIDKGKIIDIIASPRLDVRTAFGFAAPISVWEKFLSPNPPPLFHDFFAMLMRVPEFTLEGDSFVAMQNARALHRLMNIMREIGTPNV